MTLVAVITILGASTVLPSRFSKVSLLDAHAEGATEHYDTALQPVQPNSLTALELERSLKTAANDPVAMFQVVRRASAHDQLTVAFDTLNLLRQEQANNAVVQSAYCLTFNWIKGDFVLSNHKRILTNTDYDNYGKCLQQSYKLDSKLWLTYAVEGTDLVGIPDVEANNQGLSLLKKAVELAPGISITHFLLGRAYAVYDTKFQDFDKAADELHKATELKPVMFAPALSLLDLYCLRAPDKNKAIQAKITFLRTIPPGRKLSSDTTGLLNYCSKKFGQ